jgi:hypothetical protein
MEGRPLVAVFNLGGAPARVPIGDARLEVLIDTEDASFGGAAPARMHATAESHVTLAPHAAALFGGTT